MDLLEGIKIINNCDVMLSEKLTCLELNNGYQETMATTTHGEKTNRIIYIPNNSWRNPTEQEFDKLFDNRPPQFFSDAIELFSLPSEIKILFQSTDIHAARNKKELEKAASSESYKAAVKSLITFLSDRILSEKDFEVQPAIFNPSGLLSVTYYPQDKTYSGLHFDNCQDIPMTQSHLARNRFCVNLGKEPRYFVYHNLLREDMVKYISPKVDLAHPKAKEFIGKFLHENKHYPLTKLKLNPYDAYIAPIERIMHDGYTKNMTSPDISLVIRGYFGISTKAP